MEISFHLNSLDSASGAYPARAMSENSAARDEVALENSRALTNALLQTPASRDDIVRRATELVGQPHYPPPETIRRISHLLAIQMQPEAEA